MELVLEWLWRSQIVVITGHSKVNVHTWITRWQGILKTGSYRNMQCNFLLLFDKWPSNLSRQHRWGDSYTPPLPPKKINNKKIVCRGFKYTVEIILVTTCFKVRGYVNRAKGWKIKVYSISTRLHVNNHRSFFFYLNIFVFQNDVIWQHTTLPGNHCL